MVFLVHHHPQPVRQKDRRPTPEGVLRVETRELFADEMALMEKGARSRWQLVEPIHHRLSERWSRDHRVANLRENTKPLAVACPAREGVAFDIACESDPCR